MSTPQKSGFSLVELLVAMVIIAILTVLGLFGISAVQRAARDAQRRDALTSINVGINDYYERAGGYPTSVGFNKSSSKVILSNLASPAACPSVLGGGQYCVEVPLKGSAVPSGTDLKLSGYLSGNTDSNQTSYCYVGGVVGGYFLAAKLENGQAVEMGTATGTCGATTDPLLLTVVSPT